MACIITYKNNKYSQQEFEKYFKNNFNEFVNEFLSQDIEGFKEFVNREESLFPGKSTSTILEERSSKYLIKELGAVEQESLTNYLTFLINDEIVNHPK